jgi:hypothetical protein
VGAPGSGSDCNGPSPYEASVLAALLSAVVFTQSSAVPQAGTLKVGDLFPERPLSFAVNAALSKCQD